MSVMTAKLTCCQVGTGSKVGSFNVLWESYYDESRLMSAILVGEEKKAKWHALLLRWLKNIGDIDIVVSDVLDGDLLFGPICRYCSKYHNGNCDLFYCTWFEDAGRVEEYEKYELTNRGCDYNNDRW